MSVVRNISVVDGANVSRDKGRGPAGRGLVDYASRGRGNVRYFLNVTVLRLQLRIRSRRMEAI